MAKAATATARRYAAEAEAALDAAGGELTLVPFAKAYSGLTDEERAHGADELLAVIRRYAK